MKYKIITTLFPLFYLTSCGEDPRNVQRDYLEQVEVVVDDIDENSHTLSSENIDGYLPPAVESKDYDLISRQNNYCISFGLKMAIIEPNESSVDFKKRITKRCTIDSLDDTLISKK